MSKPKITEVAGKIVDLLEQFESEERHRIVSAALVLLGEEGAPIKDIGKSKNSGASHESNYDLSRQANTWLKQNGITLEILEQVFHISGNEVDVIASEIPGKDIKTKTINAYVLVGVGQLLSSGEPLIDDKLARALCKSSGNYSETNHSTYLKGFGNKVTGTKGKGWKLTAPGLKHGANIVKEIASAS